MKRIYALISLLWLAGCLGEEAPDVARLSGTTMGTHYNITAIGADLDAEALGAAVRETLARVDMEMSNWNPNSEVARFSASDNTNPQAISSGFLRVMQAANEVHAQSGGMFDVSLGPLIELWGFGDRKPEDPVPSDAAITEALAKTGQDRLLLLDTEAHTLAKRAPGVEVFVAAIAKGYGIDAVAETLRGAGIENYMVEIGGDLVTLGHNDTGQPWRIGVETPEPGKNGSIERIIALSGYGMATSGDYRNFFEHEGRRYSHIIDPTTGRPITHSTTSVTVLAENAMLADAWATTMLVLGAERGLAVADQHNLAVFFIARDGSSGENGYITQQSDRFTQLTATD